MGTFYPPYPISEELQAAGVVFIDNFTNEDLSLANGALFIGAPPVDNGVYINAAFKYVRYNAPKFSNAIDFSIVFEFIPDYEFNDNTNHYVFASWPNVELALLKSNSNALVLYVAGGSLFASAAFAPYWKAGQKNTLVISAKSGNTSVKLNGVLVIDSDGSTFDPIQLEYINLFAQYDGSLGSTGVIKKFVFMNVAIDDLDMAQWESGGLDLDFSGDKSLLTVPMRQAYENSDSEYITPVRGCTIRQACLMGSDGKTPAQYPSILYDQGLGFDGASFGTVLDSPELTFADENGDKPFTVGVRYKSGDPSVFAAFASKIISSGNGEWFFYQSAGKIGIACYDQSNASFISQVMNTNLIKDHTKNWMCTGDGSGLNTGLKIYENGGMGNSSPGGSGVYTQMRNTTVPFEVGKYSTFIVPAGSEIRALQLWDKEFSSQQAKVWSYLAERGMIR